MATRTRCSVIGCDNLAASCYRHGPLAIDFTDDAPEPEYCETDYCGLAAGHDGHHKLVTSIAGYLPDYRGRTMPAGVGMPSYEDGYSTMREPDYGVSA